MGYLIDSLTNKPRARELRRVRHRLSHALDGIAPDSRLRQRALDLRQLRERLSSALASVTACSQCVRPKCSLWPGGHCCSGSTEAIFTREELVALRLAGTRRNDLRAPREQLAGCVFRGRAGCALKLDHRPCLCVRYTCRELEAELTARGDRACVGFLQRQLRDAFDTFSLELHTQTANHELLDWARDQAR